MRDLASETAIVVPVKNEAHTIIDLLNSFENLSIKPREIIIVDGGSKDNTIPVIKNYIQTRNVLPYKIRLIELDKAFPGKARNTGIESTSARIIACTDAGCTVHVNWLKYLILSFKKDPQREVVIGSCLSDARSPFERYAFLINIKGLDETRFTYFGAVSIAFLKDVWKKIGGYPDEIYPNEDKCFLVKLKKCGAKVYLSKEAIVRWRPRSNLIEFAAQYFSYGRADARFNFVPVKHLIRLSAYGAGLILIILGFAYRALWLICLFGLLFYLMNFTFDIYLRREKKIATFFYIPLLLLTKDISQILGYMLGLIERCFNPKYRRIAKEKFLMKSE